jgi:Flp pilus assembly pilin Flp
MGDWTRRMFGGPFGRLRAFADDARAATSIEYGLMAALVAAVAIPAISSLGSGVSKTMTAVSEALDDKPPMATPGGDGGGAPGGGGPKGGGKG